MQGHRQVMWLLLYLLPVKIHQKSRSGSILINLILQHLECVLVSVTAQIKGMGQIDDKGRRTRTKAQGSTLQCKHGSRVSYACAKTLL